MPQYDEPLALLKKRRPSSDPPDDLQEFWDETLQDSRELRRPLELTKVDCPLAYIDVFDLRFSGYGGDRLHAWLRCPRHQEDSLPVVVHFPGYTGGRGLAHQVGPWANAGLIEVFTDVRGQGTGSGWAGSTPDNWPTDVSAPGMMTRGIRDPHQYYYRRVIADCVMLLECLRQIDTIDKRRIYVEGTSQGGGLALAVSGLCDFVAGTMANVPFLCDFPRAIRTAQDNAYLEVGDYLRTFRDETATAERTLSYFDAALLGQRATSPALFSVALEDRSCPPSTVFAAFNAYGGEKDLVVYEFNDHEGGQFHQEARQLDWLRKAGTPTIGAALS